VEVEASQGTENRNLSGRFEVKDRPVEYYDASLDAGNLRSIATQTGAGIIHWKTSQTSRKTPCMWTANRRLLAEALDVPILFMMLVALLSGEWLWRKKKGLA
jgi:hypothetical protein